MRTLRAVCARVGIDAGGAELVGRGEIAVYELRPLWLVARIARTTDYLADVKTEVAVARWLESAAFPAARLAGPVDQPIVSAGRVVTFWAQVSEGDSYGTVEDLARLLRRLHDLDSPSPMVLPELQPFTGTEQRIRRAQLPEGDREFLLSRVEELRESYAHLEFVLPSGPIHGNPSVSSVVRSMWDSSRVVLVDLDGFAVGPREWDLVLTAMYFERFGWHTRDEYLDFADVYGFDVMTWPGYTVLRNVRELILVTWLAQNPRRLPEISAEVSKRIADLRADNAG